LTTIKRSSTVLVKEQKTRKKDLNLLTYAYTRVSTDSQDLESQKYGIQEHCTRNDISVEEWLAVQISSRKTPKQRRLDELLAKLKKDDTLIVAELSRLGRSISEIVLLVDSLIQKRVTLIAIKENIVLNGKPDLQTKVMVTMFSLIAEVERDLISSRTKIGLQNARARGVRLGNPNLRRQNNISRKQADEFAESLRTLLLGFIGMKLTQRQIVGQLNDLGIKTRRHGEWTLVQLQNVMKRLGLKTVRAKS
jgi:putative DNA-invertase from lambdoid prophage Rac